MQESLNVIHAFSTFTPLLQKSSHIHLILIHLPNIHMVSNVMSYFTHL